MVQAGVDALIERTRRSLSARWPYFFIGPAPVSLFVFARSSRTWRVNTERGTLRTDSAPDRDNIDFRGRCRAKQIFLSVRRARAASRSRVSRAILSKHPSRDQRTNLGARCGGSVPCNLTLQLPNQSFSFGLSTFAILDISNAWNVRNDLRERRGDSRGRLFDRRRQLRGGTRNRGRERDGACSARR